VGNFQPPQAPGYLDFASATVYPIGGPFLAPPLASGRNHVLGAIRAPVVRVVNTGSCLNIREKPSLDAPVIYCAADGVLLRRQGATADDRWLMVAVPYLPTPDNPEGALGYASAEYLE
jgi:hypothetical protein